METPTLMQTLSGIFTQIMTWIGTMLQTITSNEFLLIPFVIFLVGAVIGLVTRLIR